jgi:hypothetical protein
MIEPCIKNAKKLQAQVGFFDFWHINLREEPMNTNFFALFMLSGLVFSCVAAADSVVKPKLVAGSYVENREDVPGWNDEVCTAFKRYLNSFPAEDSFMGCGLKSSPTMREITFPEWKKIDILKNAEIVKKMDLFVAPSNYTEEQKKLGWEDYIKRAIARDPNYSLYVASIDIDNDGKPEQVYRKDYLVSSCSVNSDVESPPAPSMIAFDADGRINYRASLYISLGHYIFFYRGETYWTLWARDGDGVGISVNGYSRNLCRFSFIAHK